MLRPRGRKQEGLDEAFGPNWRAYALLLFLFGAWMVTRGILLHQLQHAAVVREAFRGELTPLQSGVVHTSPSAPSPAVPTAQRAAERAGGDERSVHVVLTSNGNPYMNWQTRVFYATYLRVLADDPGGIMARGAFTRVLHRSTDDELMHEVPTWRVTPVHVNCDVYCSFPVADRAPALLEWARTPESKRCSHIMLVETDYVFVHPLTASILPPPGRALGFPYSYIIPAYPAVTPFALQFYPDGPLTDIPPTGNAPMLLAREDFERILPVWSDFVARIEADERAVETLGWVRDMYAWSFAAAKVKLPHDLPAPPNSPLMVQPPADTQAGEAAILHYTWGPEIYNSSNSLVWQFDKRIYAGGQYSPGPRKMERIPEPPTFAEGLHLQSFFAIGNAITPSGLELMRLFVRTFNAAVDSLTDLPKGYTDRAAAEQAALPSPAAADLADKVQRELALKEEAMKQKPAL